MEKNSKCDIHEKEIAQIKTDITKFKGEMTKKIDELIDEVRKPIFTDSQWIGFIFGIAASFASVVMYINSTKVMAQNNKDTITEVKKDVKKDYDNIMKILLEIKEDVGETKSKQ